MLKLVFELRQILDDAFALRPDFFVRDLAGRSMDIVNAARLRPVSSWHDQALWTRQASTNHNDRPSVPSGDVRE